MGKPDIVDLFCGAGGLSVGFCESGFDVIAGVDSNEQAVETFKCNHSGSEGFVFDIREEVPEVLQGVDPTGVVGGPPCQGFSDAKGSRYVEDDRNGLVFEYIRWVSEFQPEFAVMENVTGILSIGDNFMGAVEAEFNDIGYPNVEYKTLTASDYGVPQNRERVILIAYRDESVTESHPEETHTGSPVTVWDAITDLPEPVDDIEQEVQTGVSDNSFLEFVCAEDRLTTNHVSKPIKETGIKNKIPTRLNAGEMYRSTRFGDRYRQVWEILSDEFTEVEQDCLQFIGTNRSKQEYRIRGKTVGHVNVQALVLELPYGRDVIIDALNQLERDGWVRSTYADHLFGYDLNTQSGVRPRYMRVTPDEPSNTIMTTDFTPREKLHPYENRGLSLREGARIQSFPDDFHFTGSFKQVSNQIGNAVPPRLAQNIAEHIRSQL